MNEVKALMNEISEMPKAKELMEQWKVGFDKEPVKVVGTRMQAGSVIMGNNF